MKKIISTLSILIISLFALAVFGWMSVHIYKGDKSYGFLDEPVKFMYSFLDQFKQTVEEVNKLPETFIQTPKHFYGFNNLKKDVVVLSSYSENDSTIGIALRNLRNNLILKNWKIKHRHSIVRILHPIYNPDDGSLIYALNYKWDPLTKLDSTGKVVWKQDRVIVHHGMELNADGDIWACTKEKLFFNNGMVKIAGRPHYYKDYTITKFSSKTGKILFHKSISEILRENDLGNYVFKAHKLFDPLHVNDVQPALKTTEFYQKDDIFISLRTISTILHYRPSTNELINLIEGPFVSQHDVDIIDDSTISVFNNNFFPGSLTLTFGKPKNEKRVVDVGDFYSNIVTYDLKNDKFHIVGDSLFREKGIRTQSEGLQEFFDDGSYLVEEQNPGLLWIIKNDQVIYKDVFKSQHEGYHHLPNWTRVVDLN